MSRQKIFGEGFAALQLRGSRTGPKTRKAPRGKVIDYPCNQGRLGSDDGEFTPLRLSEACKALDVEGINVNVFELGFGSGSCVARCHIHPCHIVGLREFPRQGVLATPTSDNQYLHLWALNAENAACR